METLRYLNKQYNRAERQNFSNWWKEQISIYGMEINYYSNATNLSSSNVLYGESSFAGFLPPQPLVIAFTLDSDILNLARIGLVADGEFKAVIHPETFTETFGLSAEPRAGDLVELTEFGIDRINYPKRGPMIFELTESVDEMRQNALAGHYVWFLSARRYQFTQAPNSPGPGLGNTRPDDNQLIDDIAAKNFNYDVDNFSSNTNVYGNY